MDGQSRRVELREDPSGLAHRGGLENFQTCSAPDSQWSDTNRRLRDDIPHVRNESCELDS